MNVMPTLFDGPVEVKDKDGMIVLSIGRDVAQEDGPLRYTNTAGTPYGSWVIIYKGKNVEECEDVGLPWVLKEFETRLLQIINDEDFYSIEWRRRPELEYIGDADYDANIVDKVTGEVRKGIEPREKVQIRSRLIVHKKSGIKQSDGLEGIKSAEA